MELADTAVLVHDDADYERIAVITGQRLRQIGQRGEMST